MSAFLVAVISVGMWILICIFLMINDVYYSLSSAYLGSFYLFIFYFLRLKLRSLISEVSFFINFIGVYLLYNVVLVSCCTVK